MRFNYALRVVSGLLFASAVLAAPQSGLLTRAEGDTDTSHAAGAILSKDSGTFTSVHASLVIPHVFGVHSYMSIWTGIDIAECSQGVRAGIDVAVNKDGATFTGNVSFAVWSQLYPNSRTQSTDGLSISPGDAIKITVISGGKDGEYAGEVQIVNHTKGRNWFNPLTPTKMPCGRSVQWMIDVVSQGGTSFHPLTDFGRLTFADAVAHGPPAVTYTLADGVKIVNIKQNNHQVTSTTIDRSSLTINYV